jgi:hypothetical protein
MESFAKATIIGAVLLAIILSVFFGLNLGEPYLRGLDDDLVLKVKDALGKAGENSQELKEALFESHGKKRRAMAYLVSWMPASDLSTVTSEYLLENIELSFEAWEESGWKDQVDEELFLSYVLPHRVSQEPLEEWRSHLREELQPLVSEASTMAEAALLVNRWAGDMVTYKPTARRDQGPMETLKSGYGRCEELVILYVDALRSVGIPARQAWTPFWADRDDNHAWAEVYADGRWHYTGACEPRDSLNAAWFDDAVKRAALIYSKPYGIPAGESVESRDGDYRINSTSIYADVGTLAVHLPAYEGYKELTKVHVSVFNYGALRSIASEELDESGSATFELGLGSYLISLQADGELVADAVHLDQAATVQMELTGDPVFAQGGRFWLRY